MKRKVEELKPKQCGRGPECRSRRTRSLRLARSSALPGRRACRWQSWAQSRSRASTAAREKERLVESAMHTAVGVAKLPLEAPAAKMEAAADSVRLPPLMPPQIVLLLPPEPHPPLRIPTLSRQRSCRRRLRGCSCSHRRRRCAVRVAVTRTIASACVSHSNPNSNPTTLRAVKVTTNIKIGVNCILNWTNETKLNAGQ